MRKAESRGFVLSLIVSKTDVGALMAVVVKSKVLAIECCDPLGCQALPPQQSVGLQGHPSIPPYKCHRLAGSCCRGANQTLASRPHSHDAACHLSSSKSLFCKSNGSVSPCECLSPAEWSSAATRAMQCIFSAETKCF